jgi:hypothetical protein
MHRTDVKQHNIKSASLFCSDHYVILARRRLRMWCVELFNYWGVGNAESNNGLMMVLLKDQRKLESVTGLGLEEVNKSSMLSLTMNSAVFRARRYYHLGR